MLSSGNRPFMTVRRLAGVFRVVALGALLCLPRLGSARTLVDELGRKVVVPEHPHRIACLLPSIADTVFALGAASDVVAVSDFSIYPIAAKSKPSIGSPIAPSIEKIVALRPDIVLAEADLNPAETLTKLEKAHLTVFFIQPHGLEGIYKSIYALGQALNRPAQAQALAARLRGRVAAVRARVAGKTPVTVLLPVWHDPVLTIGRGAFVTELIQIAGGRSVTADLPEEWPQISMETVLARQPEALLLVRGSPMTIDLIRSRPGWSSLPAVKKNRILYTDERLESPSPVAFDALEDLARQFHP